MAAFLIASLTLESGLLVWVVVVAAWVCGMRGISRRAVLLITALLGLYLSVRFFYLSTGMPALTERSAGYLLSTLEPEQLVERFSDAPIWFYAYNVCTSIMSVLFSEPQGGVFEIVRTWRQGDVPPRLFVALVSSVMTTVLIGWSAVRILKRGRGSSTSTDQFIVVFAAVLVANAVISYAYTKDEIVSVAGAFYALAVFAAARQLIEYMRRPSWWVKRVALCLILVAVASVWAFRSAGVHHMLRVQSFKVRTDWSRIAEATYRDAGSPEERRAAALVQQLRREALEMRAPNRYLLPRWADRWWGE